MRPFCIAKTIALISTLAASILIVACDDSSSSPAESQKTPQPGIVGEWTLDTTLMISGLENHLTGVMRVTEDSQVIDTIERYNNDGGDIEILEYASKRRWSVSGDDVIFTKKTCAITDYYGDWHISACSTPLADTIQAGLTADLSSLRVRRVGGGVVIFHKSR